MNRGTKTFIAAIVIIPAVVFSLTFYFSKKLKNDISAISDVMNTLDEKLYSFDETGISVKDEEADMLVTVWKSHSDKWGFFIDHEIIHQIDYAISEYVCEIKTGEYASAVITSARIKASFETLSEHDTLNMSNLF